MSDQISPTNGMIKANILFLDDDALILKCLQKMLSHEPYHLHVFTNPHEALASADDQEYDLVVSDMRMPEMNGAQFLKAFGAKQPDVTRVILSGYSERDAFMEAIHVSQIWSFLDKPWDNEHLKVVIRNGIQRTAHARREKDLLKTLAQQNKDLQQLNENLEQQVKDRTKEIQRRTDILHEILNEGDEDKVVLEITSELSERFGVKIQFRPSKQELGPNAPDSISVYHHENILGHLSSSSHWTKEQLDVLEHYIPLISLAVSMSEAKKFADHGVENIDSWIEAL